MISKIPEPIEMIRELVAIPTVSSTDPRLDHGNRPAVELLAGWLDALRFDVEVQALPGHPEKANLVATLGSGPDGLILAGHTDTVPFDEGLWSQDPFTLTERDGRLYGLGTSDMKSFLALATEAARAVAGCALRRPLVIVATADEESTMAGAQALLETGRPLGLHAVIGEPTGLRPVHKHKGIMVEVVRLTGRPGHSSDPRLGVNALEGMHRVMGEILRWRRLLQSRYRDDSFPVPVATLNLGHIHGGDSANRICGYCELHFDLRILPGMEITLMREELRKLIAVAASESGLHWELSSQFAGIPAFRAEPDSALVATAAMLTGYPPAAVAFGTEAPYLQQLGVDTLILGPGDIEQAHQPDESLPLERIPATLSLLQSLVERFCLT